MRVLELRLLTELLGFLQRVVCLLAAVSGVGDVCGLWAWPGPEAPVLSEQVLRFGLLSAA